MTERCWEIVSGALSAADVVASIMTRVIPFFLLVVSVPSACPKNPGEGGFSGCVSGCGKIGLHGDVLEPTPYLMEDAILNLIEAVKEMLRKGIPSLNIPPLDPLEIEHRKLEIDVKDLILLNGSVSDVLGVNFLSFNASKLNISLSPLSFEMRFDWDPLRVRGKYDIDGALLTIIPVYGNGNFEGDYSGIYFHFRIEIGTKAAQLRVKSLDLDFGIENVYINLENFLGGALGDAVCELISETFPQMVRQLKVVYLDDVKDGIKAILDGFLEGMTMQELIDFLLGFLNWTGPK